MLDKKQYKNYLFLKHCKNIILHLRVLPCCTRNYYYIFRYVHFSKTKTGIRQTYEQTRRLKPYAVFFNLHHQHVSGAHKHTNTCTLQHIFVAHFHFCVFFFFGWFLYFKPFAVFIYLQLILRVYVAKKENEERETKHCI